ncbi:Kri1p NDAI_0A06240 [Naumovozyma dairenensis CBS 421]|uniref:Kri1-like C-terminal domain-containing protein n=1 Tax=Naumovozyma dairenensis (strain ATCC 10597 / BCRC 20456 / CBS 421 / NBRC 0211 / NRRL Y-12639) TaxID=1071378 RepID=G0W4P0_NAUDC|nr:hypothetical protein NDAI_0A06240 [Naumovozyma dairenensis CBS 421]CCD22778.1 hypothetical protein NDAI_0A06240 [Naumovozyma dairenensis CBS 421]
MPRKKSAAKRARETAKKAQLNESPKEPVVLKADVEDAKLKVEKNDVSDYNDEDDEDDETSEDEDDFGELITEDVEEGINKVLSAIRNNETDKLLNPEVKFFEDPEKAVEKLTRTEKHKPIYLKDYHRMNILSGEAARDDDDTEQETVDGKQSYISQQKEEKSQLLNEIKNAFGNSDDEKDEEDDDGEDAFLKKKEPTKDHDNDDASKIILADPKENANQFLEEFVEQQAWIPRKGDKVLSMDGDMNELEDDEEFEDAVEKFENAYNFRYEDPNAAEIVSYARTQATLRRSQTSSRRRKRDEEKQVKEQNKTEKERKIQKKKTKKINQLTDILEQLKKEYGAEINEDMVKKITDTLLKNDFKDDEWDKVVADLFNEEFYNQEGKPTWDDEDDDIMADFYDKQKEEADKILNENNSEDEDDSTHNEAEIDNNDAEGPERKKSRKDKQKDKKSKKKEKKQLAELVENAIEQNKLAIVDEVEEEEEERKGRLRSKEEQTLKFRYREVSPESFGLTAREIFAADDTDLNEFIGLKKFAPYRPKELRAKDKRKVTKSRRLRDWRKKVFKNEKGLTGETDEILIPLEEKKVSEEQHHHSDRKRSKKRKHTSS